MPVFETFAKRQRRLRGDNPDVFVYDEIAKPLRVQLVQIFNDTLGDDDAFDDHYGHGDKVRNAYEGAVKVLRREMGVFQLPHSPSYGSVRNIDEFRNFILGADNADDCLSAVELGCRLIENVASRNEYRHRNNASEKAKAAIEEINTRFKEHGVGYVYDGEIIRVRFPAPTCGGHQTSNFTLAESIVQGC